MGGVYSCCGRRADKTGEREPLLPQHRQDVEQPPFPERVLPRQHTLNKIAAIYAALHHGKLPSQQQLDQIVDLLLNSSLFQEVPDAEGPLSARGRVVLQDIKEVLLAMRGIGDEKNDDNAVQYIFHQLSHIVTTPISAIPHVEFSGSSPIDAAAAQLPQDTLPSAAEVKEDTTQLYDSVRTLVLLLFTSSAFRLLLTDVLITAREILADAVAQVSDVADAVQSGAKVVEGVVRPSAGEVKQGKARAEQVPDLGKIRKKQAEIKVHVEKEILKTVDESTARGKAAWENLQQQTPDRVQEAVLERIKSIVRQAQADPRFQDALQTILKLSQRYYEITLKTAAGVVSAAEVGVQTAVNDTQVDAGVNVDVDPHLTRALKKAKELVERFVGGGRMDTALHDVETVVQDLSLSEQDSGGAGVTDILGRGREWLQHALKDSEWTSSEESDQQLAGIYGDARKLLHGEAPQEKKLAHDFSDTITNFQGLLEAFAADTFLQRLTNALLKLTSDTAYFTSISKPDVAALATKEGRRAAREVKREIQNDFLAFVLPRIMQAIRVIPLPRVELKSPSLDVVLDDLNISSLSFVPDGITITNQSEVHILGSDAARMRGNVSSVSVGGYHPPTVTVSEAVTRTKICITGLRTSADDIQYYADARGPLCFGWRDFGLLTLDVGAKGAPGEGVAITVEVEIAGEDIAVPANQEAYFKVIDVKADVPGLCFTIKKSRHWLFNSLILQPLLGPAVREGLSIVLAQQIRGVLENVGRKLGEASRKAMESGLEGMSWSDWVLALADSSNWGVQPEASSEDDEDSEEETQVGDGADYSPPTVTSTSVTTKGIVRTSHQPATLPEEDTVIAIGIGEQVLHDVPLPSLNGHTSLVDIQRGALDDLQSGAERVEGKVEEVAEAAVQTTRLAEEELLVANEQFYARERVESRRHGWRSDAFDF